MTHLLLIAVGGALGAVARYGVATWLTTSATRPTLPWGTIAVNLVGCLLIGALAGWADTRGTLTESGRLFLMVGILGGFTTFSAFGLESLTLFRSGSVGLALLNVALQVGGGLIGVLAGWYIVR